MAALRETIFVYGTLRRGGSQHFRMAGAQFVAAGTVRGRLYQIDWYPGLIPDEEAGVVSGEVFAADAGLLEELDRFEGGEYRRVRAAIALSGEEPISAWVWEWLGGADESRRITSGDWLDAPRN